MRNTNGLKAIQLLVFSAVFLLAACAKDKAVNTDGLTDPEKNGFIEGSRVEKLQLLGTQQSLVSTQETGSKEYLLVRSIQKANGNFRLIPGFQYNYGAVVFRIGEKFLDVLPSNNFQFSRFGYSYIPTDIILKNEPIVRFPITKHFDVGFEKNDYGETTNVLTELEDGPWFARQYMKVDWTQPTTKGFRIASSVGYAEYYQEENAYLEKALNLFDDGSFEIDMTSTLSEIYNPNSYSVSTKTTFLALANTDFKARYYEDEDFNKFGIFRTFKYKIGMQRDLMDKDLEKFAQVFNLCAKSQGGACSTNKVVWNLSNSFTDEAEYFAYRELAQKAVSAWNKVFQKALDRADEVVSLSDEMVDLSSVRHNVIAYVQDDFNGGGLLGVAQFTTNPMTGETVKARASVFKDGIAMMKGAIDHSLDALIVNPAALLDFLFDGRLGVEQVKMSLQDQSHSRKESGLGALQKVKAIDLDQLQSNRYGLNKALKVMESTGHYNSSMHKFLNSDESAEDRYLIKNLETQTYGDQTYFGHDLDFAGEEKYLSENQKNVLINSLTQVQDIMQAGRKNEILGKHAKLFGDSMKEYMNIYEAREQNMAEMGIHSAEIVEEGVLHYIKNEVLKSLKGSLGANLTDEETLKELRKRIEAGETKAIVEALVLDLGTGSSLREHIKSEVGKRVFYTTLLHEMGHAFGLRHNFIASVDEKNFHPKYHEIKQKLQAGDQSFSPYDLEKWSFSSVMDYNAGFVSDLDELGPYDQAAIQYAYNPEKSQNKTYLFCSDEDVADNFLCNRHDRGLNLSEITLNHIRSYKNRYYKAYFRQGRTIFRSGAAGLMYRYMLPIRSVMDESIYQLIHSTPAPPRMSALGCSSMADASSVANREFLVNICQMDQLENFLIQNKIDKKAIDLDAPEYALNLNQSIQNFIPMQRGDLVLATLLAKNFYREILSSPEPGAYLEEVVDGEKRLTQIPGAGPISRYSGDTGTWGAKVQEGLANLAQSRNLVPSSFVSQHIYNVTNVDIGIGKYFKSMVKSNAQRTEVQNTGSLIEKYYAMMLLSTRYLPVPKYYRASLSGNAYIYPHTRSFALEMFSKLIQKDEYMSEIPYVKTFTGESGRAKIASTQDINTQNIASIYSAISFITDQDSSFQRKISVDTDRGNCESEAAKNNTRFVAVEIQNKVLCAFDDIDGKSIVLPMLEKVKLALDEVKRWQKAKAEAPQLVEKAQMDIALMETKREESYQKLSRGAEGFEELKSSLDLVSSDDFYKLLKGLVSQPLFNLLKKNEQIQMDSFQVVVNQLAKIIVAKVDGGVPSFQKRVNELLESQEAKKVSIKFVSDNKIQGASAEESQYIRFPEGVQAAYIKTDLQALILSAKAEEEPAPNYISDAQLTQLAQFYIDLLLFKAEVDAAVELLVQANGADILLSRAVSSLDSAKAPVDEFKRIVDFYVR